MLRLALAAAVALPLAAVAQETPPEEAFVPVGFAATASLGAGGELGLESGDAGVAELEVSAGWEVGSGVRPELAAALGFAPDNHVALRPGVRVSLPGRPIQLRAAFDLANSRSQDFGWRWLLLGVAGEVRLTSEIGLFAEVDTGFKLSSSAGVPLLFRIGTSLRL